MFDSSSFANSTPLAHADTSRDVLPRGGTSHYQESEISDPKRKSAFAMIHCIETRNVSALSSLDSTEFAIEASSDVSTGLVSRVDAMPRDDAGIGSKQL
ncbi:hypothetical protein TNCV_1530811 [Trichonephila clavipes]|nr:hypothetical protein TNCV_1530811 [Trichonephila clavipes]